MNITFENMEFRIDFVSYKGLNYQIEKTFTYLTLPSKTKCLRIGNGRKSLPKIVIKTQ